MTAFLYQRSLIIRTRRAKGTKRPPTCRVPACPPGTMFLTVPCPPEEETSNGSYRETETATQERVRQSGRDSEARSGRERHPDRPRGPPRSGRSERHGR